MKPTILVADDDRDIRESLEDVLTDEGYGVASAADGLEALEYLRTHPKPALILLDWMMPRCDGAEFRRRQKADPTIASIPVVLLTADARVEEKRSHLDAEEYLMKPVELDRLLEVVERFAGP